MTETPTPSAQTLRERTAEEVRALLARKRISATQLARRMGVSQAYVWRRLDGRTAFDLDDLETIAAQLQVSVAELLPVSIKTAAESTIVRRGVEVTALYPQQAERMSRSVQRPPDHRPNGHPNGEVKPGNRRTGRFPRGDHGKAS